MPVLLDLGRDQVALGYVVRRHDTPGIAQVYDIALATGCSLLRALCGPDWTPALVSVSHGAPRNPAPYRQVFRAPVRFDAAHSQIVFSAEWLAVPIAGADAMRRIMGERIALAIERGDGQLTERLQRVVQTMVVTGEATSDRVADALGIHARVMRRQLRAEGTSFHRMINSARFEVAQQLLQETRLPLAEIAAALHYSDATAFSRAFRRWAKVSPRAWRATTNPVGTSASKGGAGCGVRIRRPSRAP